VPKGEWTIFLPNDDVSFVDAAGKKKIIKPQMLSLSPNTLSLI
jgi:hypothetical protein